MNLTKREEKLLDFARRNPGWVSFGGVYKDAIASLQAKGLIEVNEHQNYRLLPNETFFRTDGGGAVEHLSKDGLYGRPLCGAKATVGTWIHCPDEKITSKDQVLTHICKRCVRSAFGVRTMSKPYLPIQTCQYIEASYIFKGFPKAWEVFFESESDCSWGDNNRTMVSPSTIINAMQECDCEDDEQAEVDSVVAILEGLGETYIDLEN